MKAQTETKWVCIQLACSWRPRAFEEAHRCNIQAKFYNKKFPLVYESDNIRDSLYEEHGATLKHKCGKRIVTLPLLSFSLIFFFFWAFSFFWPFFGGGLLSFLWPFSFFITHLGQCSRKWWSSHFYLFTTQWLQLDTWTKMTLYECLRRCTRMCNDLA